MARLCFCLFLMGSATNIHIFENLKELCKNGLIQRASEVRQNIEQRNCFPPPSCFGKARRSFPAICNPILMLFCFGVTCSLVVGPFLRNPDWFPIGLLMWQAFIQRVGAAHTHTASRHSHNSRKCLSRKVAMTPMCDPKRIENQKNTISYFPTLGNMEMVCSAGLVMRYGLIAHSFTEHCHRANPNQSF